MVFNTYGLIPAFLQPLGLNLVFWCLFCLCTSYFLLFNISCNLLSYSSGQNGKRNCGKQNFGTVLVESREGKYSIVLYIFQWLYIQEGSKSQSEQIKTIAMFSMKQNFTYYWFHFWKVSLNQLSRTLWYLLYPYCGRQNSKLELTGDPDWYTHAVESPALEHDGLYRVVSLSYYLINFSKISWMS